ncbi:mCG144854, partial [Mus musculus]
SFPETIKKGARDELMNPSEAYPLPQLEAAHFPFPIYSRALSSLLFE